MSELVRLCVDAGHDRVIGNFSANDATTVIRNKFRAIFGTDKLSPKLIRKHKVEFYEVIEESLQTLINTGWGNSPFVERFVDYRNLALGDTNSFNVEDKTMLVVSKYSGNHHDLRRQRLDIGGSFTVDTFWYGVKIYDEFERFYTGRIDWSEFVRKIYEAFDKKMNDAIYESFMSATTYLPAPFVANGAFIPEDMMDIVENVETASGKKAAIVGTRTGLLNIVGKQDTAWISDEMRKQRNTTGMISNWEGIDLLVLPQVFENNTFNKKIDNKKLLIVPADGSARPIKFINEGEGWFSDNTDKNKNADMSIEAEYMQKFGINVAFNTLYGVYNLA